jgi:hypothetical protein
MCLEIVEHVGKNLSFAREIVVFYHSNADDMFEVITVYYKAAAARERSGNPKYAHGCNVVRLLRIFGQQKFQSVKL